MKHAVVIAIFSALFLVPSAQAGRLIFVLAGQSNMSGMAPIASAQIGAPGVVDLTSGSAAPAVEPLFKANFHGWNGAGPGIPFANRLASLGYDVGLVQCAFPGSPLIQWERGGGDDPLTGRRSLARECLERVAAVRRYGELGGILFQQGETDALYPERANVYAREFERFARDFRADLGSRHLPFVYAQIGIRSRVGTLAAYDGWEEVCRQQAAARISGAAMVGTDDLARMPDGAHWNQSSNEALGERFASAWLSLLSPRIVTGRPF